MTRHIFSFSAAGTCSPSFDDETYLINATSGALTRTLPDATACRGKNVKVVKTDASANAVTVNTTSSQTMTGVGGAVTTKALAAQGNSVTCESDGTGWWIVAST